MGVVLQEDTLDLLQLTGGSSSAQWSLGYSLGLQGERMNPAEKSKTEPI